MTLIQIESWNEFAEVRVLTAPHPLMHALTYGSESTSFNVRVPYIFKSASCDGLLINFILGITLLYPVKLISITELSAGTKIDKISRV